MFDIQFSGVFFTDFFFVWVEEKSSKAIIAMNAIYLLNTQRAKKSIHETKNKSHIIHTRSARQSMKRYYTAKMYGFCNVIGSLMFCLVVSLLFFFAFIVLFT